MYEYIGMHMDDLLMVGLLGLPNKIITTLQTIFTIKGGGEPKFNWDATTRK